MNKSRRQSLKIACGNLENSISIVQNVLDEEEEALSNMPENLEGSELYERLENNVDVLEDAISEMESVLENIETVIEN